MTAVARAIACTLVLAVLAAGCTAVDGGRRTVEAIVPSSVNLFEGSRVNVLGLPVGSVTAMAAHEGAVRLTLAIDRDVDLPADVRTIVMPTSALGERVVELHPAYREGPTLPDGATIPLERSAVPAEVDEVLASLEGFLADLDPDRLGALVTALADTFEGQGEALNTMIAGAADAVAVLAAASDDLVGAVTELGGVTATLAERTDRLGPLLTDLSTVLRTVGEESDAIAAAVRDLHRLTVAIAPLARDHADALVTDLATLATSMASVERNLDRVTLTIHGARRLFEAGGLAFDYENAFLPLDNQSDALQEVIADRLTDRLVGLCLRLGEDDCAAPEFWLPFTPALLCVPGLGSCPQGAEDLGEVLAQALGRLPAPVLEELPLATAPAPDGAADDRDAAPRAPAPAPPPPAPAEDPGGSELDALVERLLRGEPRP